MLEFNILILGNAGCGKTTFLKRIKEGIYTKDYTPTLTHEITTTIINTNEGHIKYNIHEHSELYDYDGAIICIENAKDIDLWTKKIKCPYVICIMKSEKKLRTRYLQVSSKLSYNLDKPLLFLSRELLCTTNIKSLL